MLPEHLYGARFDRDRVRFRTSEVPYSNVSRISYCNIRHSTNLIPDNEVFCIEIKPRTGSRTVLFKRISLRPFVGRDSKMRGRVSLGFRIAPEVEAGLSRLRREHIATVELLRHHTGIEPVRGGFFFESWAATYAMFRNSA